MDEKGIFYIGKECPEKSGPGATFFLDSKDLVTHTLVVGMTGSGKTGLCLALLEEAVLSGIPFVAIDFKGDICNLLLPLSTPSEFATWVDPAEASRQGLTQNDLAARTCEVWNKGRADWGMSPERVERFRNGADFRIYTPGSTAGIQVNILRSFDPPSPDVWEDQREEVQERIQGVVSSLLSLASLDADPLKSREHVLLSNLFQHYWQKGESLPLDKLILSVQQPPFSKLGALDVEQFFPAKERQDLVLALNNLLASPSFSSWREGVPLDVDGFLKGPSGKPVASIFYLAHLSDSERLFFTTLLAQDLIGWMRKQQGTGDLRAIFYIDELFGYLPPYPKNPPTKAPLLTLLKQARAFGLGLLLATQNPKDLDYKAVSNTGTWFVGKLSTTHDRERLLEGLTEASQEAGKAADETQRAGLDRLIASLEKRIFLCHNIHKEKLMRMMSRWTISYLRGPLTRKEIRSLRSHEVAPPPDAPSCTIGAPVSAPHAALSLFPKDYGINPDAHLMYAPGLSVEARVSWKDEKKGIHHQEVTKRMLLWDGNAPFMDMAALEEKPPQQGKYLSPPSEGKTALTQRARSALEVQAVLSLWENPALKIFSRPGETKEVFLARCLAELPELLEKTRGPVLEKLEKQREKLQEKLKKAQDELEKDQAEYSGRQSEELLNAGESILGFVMGKKRGIGSSLTRAASKRRQAARAKTDLEASREAIKDLESRILDLAEEEKRAIANLEQEWKEKLASLRAMDLLPDKVEVLDVRLIWVPLWESMDGAGKTLRHCGSSRLTISI
ncbi:MAG: DUF87 domain-containing protein [Armatimonadetes bacterium]|nr:DUF87 domain-containing protein [Armatimonadota bacterium]